MKKSLMSLALLALIASSPASAALPGGTNYWAASADIVGGVGHSGIVVTDSTYAACVDQFSAAMANHAAVHGDVFTNIQYCHYVSSSFGGIEELHQELNYVDGSDVALPNDVQIALDEQFIKDMSALEEDYHLSEFIQKRDALIKRYIQKTQREKKVVR